MKTQDIRNLDDLTELRKLLRVAETTRSTIYGLPETAKALDREIVRIKKRMKKLDK